MADEPAPRLCAFSAVFTVSDIGRSLRFFVERLRFVEQFRLGDPVEYAILDREAVSLHLMPASRGPEALGRSSIYVFVERVDALDAELRAAGCAIEKAPADFDYGMREMSIRDPDGNRITFGEATKGAAGAAL